ncbi:LacI family DNA-binding transcriptional regulator [Advenella sp. FME57]|uniref:LacI family DNA-binding transcriptional regulator n=1 Tax=Advenella sp. FME57 TaxID=2742604 RepID=UPI001868B182|nr:LacI family DNA-binding transcriptional regulator [Advenella sp. FME57]
MTATKTVQVTRRKAGSHTIHDVAALAGVSSTTVSRYFNAPNLVSAGVRERLKEIIEHLGYVPSQVASGLASGHGRVVCAAMQNIGSITFADLVKGMTDELQASGLQLLLANVEFSQELEEKAIRTFIGWHPTALILTREDHTPATEAMLRKLKIPVVEAWGMDSTRPYHQIGYPQAEAGAILARHFLDQGARRIQFVLPNRPEDFRAKQRIEGFTREVQAAGIAADILIMPEQDDFDAGVARIEAFSKEPVDTRPQALVFANDNMGAGAILHAPAVALTLPRDCAMASFGNASVSPHLRPALTTLKPQRYYIGQQTARTVLDLLSRPKYEIEPIQKLIPCELIVRDSSQFNLT